MAGQLTDVWVKIADLEPGASLRLSKAEAREFFHWQMPTGDEPRTRYEITGALWRYNIVIEFCDAVNAYEIRKRVGNREASPFAHLSASELADLNKRARAGYETST